MRWIDASPVVSSGNSTTSNSSENLEIAPNPNRMSLRPQPVVYQEKDIFDRLHTSTTRKVGEAPISDKPIEKVKLPGPHVIVKSTPPANKPKKERWSVLGKKNAAAVAAT